MTEPTAPLSGAGPQPGGRRRIDHVLAPDFLDGLSELDLEDVRAHRKEAEQEEADLSYVRRLLQGRSDILKAEQARRAGGGGDVVEHLARILADEGRTDRGLGRFLTVEPSRVDEHRRAVEQIVADVGISDVEARSDVELRKALSRLETYEHEISEHRRAVQTVLDACTGEIARRYKDGSANVDDLLSEG